RQHRRPGARRAHPRHLPRHPARRRDLDPRRRRQRQARHRAGGGDERPVHGAHHRRIDRARTPGGHMTMQTTALAPAERAVRLLGGDLTERSLRQHLEGLSGVDAVGLEQRAAGLATRSIKTSSKAWALDRIIELIDLTTLEGADPPGKVRSLVAKARTPDPADPTTPRVAA